MIGDKPESTRALANALWGQDSGQDVLVLAEEVAAELHRLGWVVTKPLIGNPLDVRIEADPKCPPCGRVYLNGQEVSRVRAWSVDHHIRESTAVTLTLLPDRVEVVDIHPKGDTSCVQR